MSTTIERFTVPAVATRVLFGDNVVEALGEIVDELGASRVIIVGSSGRSATLNRLIGILGSRYAGSEHRAVMHVPEPLVHEVLTTVRAAQGDLLVAVGGGSAIGMAKAIALNGGPPFVAIPTTYSGSEMTPIWGVTSNGIKKTGRAESVRPKVVLYDPMLSSELPLRVAVPSALNALAHCVEALYAPDANPLASSAAAEGARTIVHSLRLLPSSEPQLIARRQLLEGAWLAGFALGMVQMGLHHKMCHVLGGSFGMPHAETHAILLPYSLAYNFDAAFEQLQPIRDAVGVDSAEGATVAMHDLVRTSLEFASAPVTLSELGLGEADVPRAADLATATPYPNPAPLDRLKINRMLRHAINGTPTGTNHE